MPRCEDAGTLTKWGAVQSDCTWTVSLLHVSSPAKRSEAVVQLSLG